MNPKRRSVPAGEFKAKCLAMLDEVAMTGEEIIITKRGKPVAKVSPVEGVGGTGPPSLLGSVRWEGDIISPIGEAWDADR